MEQARRESLKSISDKNSTMSMKQLDSSYDSTDERECELCKYDLHLSAVGCECCPDKFACLLHGHLLCPCPWSKKTLFYRYHLEQLILLLAAVEGRPGAVANWAKQDAQLSILSPPSCRDILPSKPITDKLPGDSNGLHSHTTSVVVETSTHTNCVASTVKKETAIHNSTALGPDLMTQPSRGPQISVRNPVQVAASCDNSSNSLIRQESSDMLSHQQKPVFLKSGYARSVVRKVSPEQDASIGFSKEEVLITDLGNSARQRASFPFEKPKDVNASKSEVIILLSDDEEEITTCKLNEAGESSFSAHEVPSSDHLRAAGNPTEIITEGDPSHGYLEVVSAGGNRMQLASTMMGVRSPVQERAVQALSSGGMTQKSGIEKPEECTVFARPLNDLVTVVQRGNCSSWTPPRVARVRVRREVDVIDIGCVVVREGWHTRHAIYPAGNSSVL